MMTNTQPLDRLSALIDRFQVSTRVLHAGVLCGLTQFDAHADHGFFHVLRSGRLTVTQMDGSGIVQRIEAHEPTIFFYPRPLAHQFHTVSEEGSDFTCASVYFEGGQNHPLVRALPPLVVVPLRKIPGLEGILNSLFQEVEQVRCGHRLVADRLFEVALLQLLRWLLDNGEQCGISIGLVSGLADPQLARALTGIHENPQQFWSLELLAEQASMSRSAFASRFKKVVGVAPAEYLTDWRMSIARKKLHQGLPIKVIATELGYASASALSRVFAQRVGCPPRDWLAKNQHIALGKPIN